MTGCTDRSPLTFPHGRNGLGLENQKKAERKHKGLHFCIFCKSFERLAPSLPPGTIRQRVKLGEAGVRGWLWGKKGRDDIHQATKVCESCHFLRQLSFRQIIPRASSDSAPIEFVSLFGMVLHATLAWRARLPWMASQLEMWPYWLVANLNKNGLDG